MPIPYTDMVAVLYQDLWGISLISFAIIALFILGEVLRLKTSLNSEWTRKTSHLGAGAIVLSFPWLVNSQISVFILTAAFIIILGVGKYFGCLKSIHDVERQTSGAFYYPIAVFILFWLSKGDPLRFCLPITILALSDAGAALVGKEYGSNRYQVMDGYRSFEGSLTFFGLSLTILLTGFAIAKAPGWPEMLLIAVVISILTTAIEAISIRGLDNLLIPCSVYLMLERSLRLGLSELSGWFEGMLLSLVIILISYRITRLTTAGSISVFVAGSMAWALGSWVWFLPLLFLYLGYLSTTPKERSIKTDMQLVFPTILGALVFILLYGHHRDEALFIGYLATLSSGGAISLRMMAERLHYPKAPLTLTGAITPIAPVFFYPNYNFDAFHLLLAVISGLLAFQLLSRTPFVGRRFIATLLAGALAWGLSEGQILEVLSK